MLTNSGIFKAEGARAMTDNWEPSDAAVEAALDAYERTPGFADSVRAALIAAHAVAEKEGATLVAIEREACAKIVEQSFHMEPFAPDCDVIVTNDRDEIAASIRARGSKP